MILIIKQLLTLHKDKSDPSKYEMQFLNDNFIYYGKRAAWPCVKYRSLGDNQAVFLTYVREGFVLFLVSCGFRHKTLPWMLFLFGYFLIIESWTLTLTEA